MKNSKSFKQFENRYKLIINNLRKKEYTLFENISSTEILINLEKEYKKFKNSDVYWSYITENNENIKTKIIDLFIFESIVNSILKTKETIELNENLNLTQEVLFETTFHILEEEFFKLLNLKKEEQEIFKLIFEQFVFDEKNTEINEINENIENNEIINQSKKFLINLINFLKKTKKFSIGLIIFTALLIRTISVYSFAGISAVIKSLFIDLFNLNLTLDKFDEKIITSKAADPIVKEFLKKNYGFTVDDVIKKCWKKKIEKYKKLLPRSDFELIDKMNQLLFEKGNQRIFFSSLNNPIFYNFFDAKRLSNNRTLNNFGHEINICVFDKLKDFAVALAISTFELGEISEKLIRNLTAKNDILRVASTFKQLYQTSSQNLNKSEKLFIESILFLIDLKILVDKILLKKENLEYSIITKYESLSKSIVNSLKEIEEAYKRSKSFKDQKIRKYK